MKIKLTEELLNYFNNSITQINNNHKDDDTSMENILSLKNDLNLLYNKLSENLIFKNKVKRFNIEIIKNDIIINFKDYNEKTIYVTLI